MTKLSRILIALIAPLLVLSACQQLPRTEKLILKAAKALQSNDLEKFLGTLDQTARDKYVMADVLDQLRADVSSRIAQASQGLKNPRLSVNQKQAVTPVSDDIKSKAPLVETKLYKVGVEVEYETGVKTAPLASKPIGLTVTVVCVVNKPAEGPVKPPVRNWGRRNPNDPTAPSTNPSPNPSPSVVDDSSTLQKTYIDECKISAFDFDAASATPTGREEWPRDLRR